SPRSIRPARRRFRGPRATTWWPGWSATATRTRWRCGARTTSRRWCGPRRGRATWWSASAPERSAPGPATCRRGSDDEGRGEMTTPGPLLLLCVWIVVANAAGILPSRRGHWPAAVALIVTGIPLLGYVTLSYGPLAGFLALGAG